MRNTDLATRVADYAEAHPEEYNANDWTRCLAAITLVLSGYSCDHAEYHPTFTRPDGSMLLCWEARTEAEALLGFTEQDKERLPFGDTFGNAATLRNFRELIASAPSAI